MEKPQICIIGDIVVDVTLKNWFSETKLRLGGIVHAARALWALNLPFSVGYFAPSYLDDQISKYTSHLGAIDVIKLGNIQGAPFVFLIEEAKEIGAQGYEFLLREEIQVEYNIEGIKQIFRQGYNNYLVISGNYDLNLVLNHSVSKVHIDVANNIKNISDLEGLEDKFSSLFISTSSDLFKRYYNNDFMQYIDRFVPYAERIVLKENRGGSRGIDISTQEIIFAPAQTKKVVHSVGVGDVYDAAYIANYSFGRQHRESMIFASWIAAEYAVTTFPDDFKQGVSRVVKSNIADLTKMKGVSLPWEARSKINIYIAAPDFSYIDVSPINALEEALLYHNFKPRRPIRENGQLEKNASKAQKLEIFAKDMAVFNECAILIAVMLYDDPGTLVELGFAAAKGLPTIVYDPYRQAQNCMLTELPALISHDLDEVISEVFIQSANFAAYE